MFDYEKSDVDRVSLEFVAWAYTRINKLVDRFDEEEAELLLKK